MTRADRQTDMNHLLVLLLLLWSSGVQAEGKHNLADPDDVRLVKGASHCAGTLEVKYLGEWRHAYVPLWNPKKASALCACLDCGSVLSVGVSYESSSRLVWEINSACVQMGYDLRDCVKTKNSTNILDLTCSDSVRLLNGTSLCSGRLEVKSNQSWSPMCDADFDQQDAETVCRELGCGVPSVLLGGLYGHVDAPVWSKEFQCEGHESALLNCRSSGSSKTSCSPGRTVGLTCSEPDDVRLVEGTGRCAGTLEMKHVGEWRPVVVLVWSQKAAAVFCKHLGCGSAVSVGQREASGERPVWKFSSVCLKYLNALRECPRSESSSTILDLTCSGQQGAEGDQMGEH
ncbi:scavenger receptor cysteine-rich type 1 protein M130-like [Pholidichthys leucotaenia]